MKKHYFRFLLLSVLLLAFGTVSFAQKTKRQRKRMVQTKIVSTDFNIPKSSDKKNYKVKKNRPKKWKKRCHYVYFKRNGKMHRRYRCDGRKN